MLHQQRDRGRAVDVYIQKVYKKTAPFRGGTKLV